MWPCSCFKCVRQIELQYGRFAEAALVFSCRLIKCGVNQLCEPHSVAEPPQGLVIVFFVARVQHLGGGHRHFQSVIHDPGNLVRHLLLREGPRLSAEACWHVLRLRRCSSLHFCFLNGELFAVGGGGEWPNWVHANLTWLDPNAGKWEKQGEQT